jgi:hypothetical protein
VALIPSNGRPRPARRVAAGTLTALLCAGLLSGCGGDSSDASGGGGNGATTTVTSGASLAESLPGGLPQKKACGLITQAEVEAAIGAKVGPPKEEAQSTRSLCSFTVVAKPTESGVLISTTSSGVPAFFTSSRQRAASPRDVTAGDEAFVSGGQALVRRGDTMVAVLVVIRLDQAQLATITTKLAQAVGTKI